MSVFGSSGVRGVANEDLTPADALDLARAAGAVLDAERVAVARDTRTTGESIAAAVTAGLTAVGSDVERVGVVPTPALQARCDSAGVPGVMVTASHNPPEYNGIKLIGADGIELTRERLDAVERALDSGVSLAGWADSGTVTRVEGVVDRYCEGIVAAVDREAIADADLTVAVDPGHGAASAASPRLFRDLGCRVLTVNAQPDGRFPGRNPEPVAEHLGDLRRLVRAGEADLGIAHDGDGDRAIFVDERGEHVEGDAALAALAEADLEAGDVAVSAVNASKRLGDVVEAAGAELRLTPIGSTNLITAARDLQAAGRRVPVAGEGNGGIMFPDYRLARDGGYTAARFCELVARAEGGASDVVAGHQDYVNVRRKLRYDDEAERERMLGAIVRRAAATDADVDETDGYRLDHDDGWVLARPSGTEPVVRVYAEARTEARARELADSMADAIRTA